jgi:diguanylate cyclase (GGDEF)-like protein
MIKTPKFMIVLSSVTALTVVVIAAVLLNLIQSVSTGANKLDLEKSDQAISASIDALFEQAKTLIGDNAHWDEAVENSYGDADKSWLLDTWGTSSSEVNYSTVYILDENLQTVVGFSGGETIAKSASEFLGTTLADLVQVLPVDGINFDTAAKLLKTNEGLAIVSAAPIIPHTVGQPIPSTRARILVFVKSLTPVLIESLGKSLALDNLKLVSKITPFDAFSPLLGSDGKPLAYLSWTPDNPGDKAKAAVQWQAYTAIAAMVAYIVFLTGFSGRLFSRLRKSEIKAWEIANEDALTKLPNRFATTALLEEKFGAEIKGQPVEFTVMLADLDGFKDVNDTFGHQIGDELLQKIAIGMGSIASEYSATVSRLGGDEFAIIVDGEHTKVRAEAICEAALKYLNEPFNLGGRIIKVGFSIGIATSETGVTNGSDLLRFADVAMYSAKSRGKNQFCHYEPKLDTARNERIAMAKDLAEALKARELAVAYQPIVEARSHQIIGVEALARWQQPDGTWAQPDIFISVAEEFGLIDDLGSQILAMACAAIAPLSDLRLSVNISPAQFRNPKFVENCLAIIDTSTLARNRLELEVTEGYLIDHQDLARPIIAELQAAGIQVSLDDFGTGYSSIGYLREYKFNKLKIDKSLIQGMMTDEVVRSVVQVTTTLARSMNMRVTAEGVEHEEEATLLFLAGCDNLQGFHFGRPQSLESIRVLLNKQKYQKEVA